MCTFEHILDVLVEVHHAVLLDVHLPQLLQFTFKVSSVTYQIYILYLTKNDLGWFLASKLQFLILYFDL